MKNVWECWLPITQGPRKVFCIGTIATKYSQENVYKTIKVELTNIKCTFSTNTSSHICHLLRHMCLGYSLSLNMLAVAQKLQLYMEGFMDKQQYLYDNYYLYDEHFDHLFLVIQLHSELILNVNLNNTFLIQLLL